MGVLVTSLYQVMVNRKQRDFQMDPMQLLYYQAPLSAVMLFFVVPFLEPVEQTFARSWSVVDIIMVVLSGGSLIFHETLAINQVIGITLTLVGIILYAHVKMKDTQPAVSDYEETERKPLHRV
ncbi:hypothetical protein ANTPLA_LOCUS9483 [Anthophora plagiata]